MTTIIQLLAVAVIGIAIGEVYVYRLKKRLNGTAANSKGNSEVA